MIYDLLATNDSPTLSTPATAQWAISQQTGAKAPLYAVDPVSGNYSDVITGTWLLEEDLYVEDGITLKVKPRLHLKKTYEDSTEVLYADH